MVSLVDFKDKQSEGTSAVPTYGTVAFGGLNLFDTSTAVKKVVPFPCGSGCAVLLLPG